MKKKSLLIVLLMALFMPLAMNAQNTLLVHDGTATNNYVPIYGYYADAYLKCQMVYPAEELRDMNGQAITAMSFYTSQTSLSGLDGTFQIWMKEIDATTLGAFVDTDDATMVYEGTVSTNGEMAIIFDDAYTYNGGNLLVGVYQTETSSGYPTTTFYGEAVTSAAWQGNSYSGLSAITGSVKNFLPKTTFTYGRPSSCAKPTDLAVEYTEGDPTATISWRSDARNFNIDINGIVTATSENPYTLRVDVATTYDIKVQADCGDEQSGWASTSFFSGCPETFNVPYFNGFESEDAAACWTLSPESNIMVDLADASYAHTGNGFLFLNYTSNPPQYVISPKLGGFTIGLHVEFWYSQFTNGVETFQVGYSTTDNNVSSFTWGDVITASTTYQQFKANYPAETQYVAVKHLSDDQYYLFLDDFLFEESSRCLEPTNVQVTSVTTDDANITWEPGGDESAWDIYVTDDIDDVPDESTTPTYSNIDNLGTYNIYDLVPGTTYYVYVRAICGDDEVSAWSSYAVFNTECEPMALPYSYGFEDATLPVCWNTIIENTSYTGINLMQISETNQVLAFYMGTYQNPALVAVLPEVDEAYPLNRYQITFDACYANTSSGSMTAGKLGIGIMTDPTDFTTFELIEEVDINDAYSTFDTHNVWFNSYTGNGRYIAIRDIYTQSGYVLVDNIEVTELPSCLPPTALNASNIGDTSAELGWTANNDETEWTVYYKAEGAEDYTPVPNVTENPYTLEGLTAATNYEFYVVANCSETAQSTPSEVYTFATALCALEDQCEITYALTDSYGDGWNGNVLKVVDANTEEELATWTIASGSSASGSLSICDGRQIEIKYVLGSGSTYPSENSFVITDHLGNVIWEVSTCSASTGSVTYTVDCTVPTCLKPTELAATTTATSAVLSWTANSEETAWTLYWKENGAEEYTEEANVTDNPYTLDDLNPLTVYEFYVIANCSAEETSEPSAVYEFATECDVITVAQGSAYTYDFENELPFGCWTNVTGNNTRTAGDNHTTGGNYKLQFAGTSSGNIIAMPTFTPDINGLMLTFWTRPEGYSYSNCGTFSVGYMTDLNDASTFVAVDTYSYDEWYSNAYVEKEVSFPNAPAGAYIAFCHNAGSSYYYWFVDDVKVELVPSCFTVQTPTYSDLKSTSVKLSWTLKDESQDAWDVAYKTSEDVDFTIVPAETNDEFLLDELSAETTYTVKVRANCGAEDGVSEWTEEITITTLEACATPSGIEISNKTHNNAHVEWTGESDYFTVSYTKTPVIVPILSEDFENEANYNANWTVVNYSTANADRIGRSSAAAHESSYGFRFSSYSNATTYEEHLINKNALSGVTSETMIEFYYKKYQTSDESFKVGYSSTDSETTSFTFGENHEATQEWQKFSEAVPEGTKYISIQYTTTGCHYYLYIDDIKIGALRTFDTQTVTTTNNYVDLTLLDAGSDYEVTVTPSCDETAVSTPVTFATIPSTEKYFITDGSWGNLQNWMDELIPTIADNVTIRAKATIESGCVASANRISFEVSDKLTIADGGQLYHNNIVSNTMMQKEIVQPTEWNPYSETTDGWYLISNPTSNNMNPMSVTNLPMVSIGGVYQYDLYSYSESGMNWLNYHESSFYLNRGKGYLYARAESTTLEFTGSLPVDEVSPVLSYTETNGEMAGWNLLGNPFSHDITWNNIETNDYVNRTGLYTLLSDGSWYARPATEATVAPMQGFLVKAEATDAQLTMTNNPADNGGSRANNDFIAFSVANSQYEDAAYAMFSDGSGLEKIDHINSQIQTLYIPQNGQRFAIAALDDNTNTFNLNFKAMTTGKYTLSYKAKGQFDYLHVIDRLTGNDVDMLVEDEYEFIASANDNDARFIVKLSYSAGNSIEGDNFAWQNGDDIIINATGTLQVYDVLGRFVMSRDIYGNEHISASAFGTGVYVFRMVGDDVKTQKIVIR